MIKKEVFLSDQHIEQALLNYLQPKYHEGMLVKADFIRVEKGMEVRLELAPENKK